MSTLCIFDLDCVGPQTVVLTPASGAPISVALAGPGSCVSVTIPAAVGTFFSAVLTSETIPVCLDGLIVGTTSILGIFQQFNKCGVATCILAEPAPRVGHCGPTVVIIPVIVKEQKCPPPPCPPKPCKEKKPCEKPCEDGRSWRKPKEFVQQKHDDSCNCEPCCQKRRVLPIFAPCSAQPW